jgi:hypothetical protein
VRNIAVIAYDQGLLSSLVFSLEVAGFRVVASEGWPPGGLDHAGICCAIVDADAYRRDPAIRPGLDALDAPMIYLADDMPPFPSHTRMSRLLKPFQGPDLLQHVEAHALPAPALAPPVLD